MIGQGLGAGAGAGWRGRQIPKGIAEKAEEKETSWLGKSKRGHAPDAEEIITMGYKQRSGVVFRDVGI